MKKNKIKKDIIKNGFIGYFNGWRIGGKTYDPEGNEIKEKHEKDCFCCRKSLFKKIK